MYPLILIYDCIFVPSSFPMSRMPNRRHYYFLFAACFLIFWFLFKIGGMIDPVRSFISALIDVSVSVGAMMVTVEWLLPRLVYGRRYGLFAGSFIGLLFFCGTLIVLTQLRLSGTSLFAYRENIARYRQHYFYWFWADLILGSYFLVFLVSASGAAIRFAFDRMKAQNRVDQLERENLTAELELLKNQINPHFLFNALNTIYYKIDRSNSSARDTLQRFSELLRYQLYECNQPDISIEQELAFIKSYIDLQRERLNNNYCIETRGFNEVGGMRISPFLLMPIVENCFKHTAGGTGAPNRILIECKKENGHFILRTSNNENPQTRLDKKGIGLENIQRRLNLLYGGRHEILTARNNGIFSLTLKLDLQ
jgi:hypothetical protein